MPQVKEHLILLKSDYEIIMLNLKSGAGKTTFNRQDAEEMELELKKAKVVEKEDMPDDVVRLNSFVAIRDEKDGKLMRLTVVTPEKADIKKRKISIMSPIGTALIGYRKGQKVSWNVPSGTKTFTILEVSNMLDGVVHAENTN